MLQESEPTPEEQYHRTELRQWQVGDLVRWNNELGLILKVTDEDCFVLLDNNSPVVTEENGLILQHNTLLVYNFKSWNQAFRDFEQGLFTAYFEIL